MSTRLGRLHEALSAPRALVALAVALLATSAGAIVLAGGDATGTPDDTAFIDSTATTELVTSTTTLVGQVFSVDPQRRKAQAGIVSKRLSASAQEQFRELYAPYLTKKASRITLQTTATSVGVLRLAGDDAEVLVVADQRATAPDGRSNAGTAGIRLRLTRSGDAWQITAIDPV